MSIIQSSGLRTHAACNVRSRCPHVQSQGSWLQEVETMCEVILHQIDEVQDRSLHRFDPERIRRKSHWEPDLARARTNPPSVSALTSLRIRKRSPKDIIPRRIFIRRYSFQIALWLSSTWMDVGTGWLRFDEKYTYKDTQPDYN